MHAPFRSENQYVFTTLPQFSRGKHESHSRRIYPSPLSGKNINTLMNNGTPPPFIPKSLVVITMRTRTNNRHLQVLRDKKTDAKDNERCKYKSFQKYFHNNEVFEVLRKKING